VAGVRRPVEPYALLRSRVMDGRRGHSDQDGADEEPTPPPQSPERDRDDQRRTYYRLTPQGRRTLAMEAELLADVALEVISLSPAKA